MKTTLNAVAAYSMLLFAVSCTEKHISTPSSAATHATEKSAAADTAFFIGRHYGGGIIFYIDSTGVHGLIAATADQGTIDFGSDIIRTDARARAIGKGFINTAKIINAYGTADNYAALLCATYTGGGYKGWFLPSKQELHELYKQRSAVGGFAGNRYWSSTEVSWDWAAAWIHYFDAGVQTPSSKWNAYSVRAIRSF